VSNNSEKLEIYRNYNNQIYEELKINEKYIDELLRIIKNTPLRKTKQLCENIIVLGKKNINNFHSIIYSIPPDEIEINKKFNSDLKYYVAKMNMLMLNVKNIYESKRTNNNFDGIFVNSNPLPKNESLDFNFSFF
jgi:hypothetical protein